EEDPGGGRLAPLEGMEAEALDAERAAPRVEAGERVAHGGHGTPRLGSRGRRLQGAREARPVVSRWGDRRRRARRRRPPRLAAAPGRPGGPPGPGVSRAGRRPARGAPRPRSGPGGAGATRSPARTRTPPGAPRPRGTAWRRPGARSGAPRP